MEQEQNMPADQGGTVRYHRVEYEDSPGLPWGVVFTEGGDVRWFTAAEGEAMGLTPPAPQATITLANGRSVTIDEDVLRELWVWWNSDGMRGSATALAYELRPLFTDTDEATS